MDDCLNAIDGVLAQHDEFSRSKSITRPSAKNIYEQRKQYAQSLSTATGSFKHRVEHLLTCDLDNELRSVEDCLKHLHLLETQGRIWGQGLILQVNNGELQLKDPETRDTLEHVKLQDVENCRSVLGSSSTYNSLLTITVQSHQKKNVFLFQCDEQPADILHTNLEKALKQYRVNREMKDSFRNNLENLQAQNHFLGRIQPQPTSGGWENLRSELSQKESPNASPAQQRRFDQEPLERHYAAPSPIPSSAFQPLPVNPLFEIERDIEVLNHTLGDIDLFVGKLNADKKKKKVKLHASEFIDCLQKVKYAFNLMGKVHDHMQQPSAPDIIHLMMVTLSMIIGKCPHKNLLQSVVSPLLTQKALMLLSSCATDKERQFWESLGDAWMRTRAEWPNGNDLPTYIPIFSDGWVPPEIPFHDGLFQIPHNAQVAPDNRNFQPLLMQVIHEFEARNNREISVKKGDIVKVLDQSRQWWLVQNSQGQQGFIPSNILENIQDDQASVGSLELNPGSRPEEVKAWLHQKGFSNITVRCLGVLSGDQLLKLSRQEMKAVCPEEGGRVYLQLSTVRGALGR
ncbi:hypothetical protein GDO86_003410 [Hymenochirus boettgeri]|uniref:SH3 domain-containing protein n=1 Tax=Hymenochirus boettgeri TaxID=247094 RepID=A0A8T2K5M5_9PIPI|nr:hypothetical protein GDO86_003410 [Hymenochirus boettgeri]